MKWGVQLLQKTKVLPDEIITAVVDRAHQLGMKVASHAITNDAVIRAYYAGTIFYFQCNNGLSGVDVLAHTPSSAIMPTLSLWENKTVVSTMYTFGGVDVFALRDAGARCCRFFFYFSHIPVYGTDFGNTITTGIHDGEISRLLAAGFDGAAIIASATIIPAEFWGFEGLGLIEAG